MIFHLVLCSLLFFVSVLFILVNDPETDPNTFINYWYSYFTRDQSYLHWKLIKKKMNKKEDENAAFVVYSFETNTSAFNPAWTSISNDYQNKVSNWSIAGLDIHSYLLTDSRTFFHSFSPDELHHSFGALLYKHCGTKSSFWVVQIPCVC